MLIDDVDKFNKKYQDDKGKMKTFKISQVKLLNKYGIEITTKGEFDFTYSIGWRFHSKEPRCFSGDYLKISNPSCSLQCAGS